MNRFILYIFGIFLLAQANALALNCSLSKFQLGKSKLDFEKEKEIFLIQKVNEKISSLVVPIEYVCEKAPRLINKRNAVSVVFIFKILSFTNSLD